MGSWQRSLKAMVLCSCLGVVSSGCVPLWVGAGVAGIVGGYAVSPDTVEGTTTRPLEECYSAAKEIAGIMGQVIQESPNGGELIATINGSRVTVTLTAVNATSTKLAVKARKSFMPKIEVAQDIYAKIINNMEK